MLESSDDGQRVLKHFEFCKSTLRKNDYVCIQVYANLVLLTWMSHCLYRPRPRGSRARLYLCFTCLIHKAVLWSAVAQLVECRTRNRESPGSNPRCYRFEVWAFSFTSRRLSRLSCINEYLAIDSGGNVSE